MNLRIAALSVVAVMILVAVPAAASEDSDAAPVPTSYDFRYDFSEHAYRTNSPEDIWTIVYLGSGTTPGLEDARIYAEMLKISKDRRVLSTVSSYLPTWITFEFPPSWSGIKIHVKPGAVCNEMFWILFGLDSGKKLLMTIPIQITDGGSVAPDPSTNRFSLIFDTQGGSAVSSMTADSLERSHTFDISSVQDPSRDGFRFRGWSTDPSGEAVLTGLVVTVTLTDGTSASRTIYAAWEKAGTPTPPSIPDPLRELLELLSDPGIMLLFIAGVFGLAVLVRVRRQGMVRWRGLC